MKKDRWPTTLWRTFASGSQTTPLDTLIGQLATPVISRRLRAVKRRYYDASIAINIGIFYWGAYGGLRILPHRLAWCARAGAEIFVAAYPCSDTD
jgi:hypothetical protein